MGRAGCHLRSGRAEWACVSCEELFGAGGEHIDVRQFKGADDFAEEGGFFVVGFD